MRLREPRHAGQRARRPRWRRRRPSRSEHACHSTLTRTTLQTRVCSVGNARQLLLVEKTRGRIQEAQTSKRSPLWRLSGRRSCRRLSTSCQTSKRPSAGRPRSCTCSCLGADRSAGSHACVLLPAVRLRCVKSHALLYASVLPRRVAATLLAVGRARAPRGRAGGPTAEAPSVSRCVCPTAHTAVRLRGSSVSRYQKSRYRTVARCGTFDVLVAHTDHTTQTA